MVYYVVFIVFIIYLFIILGFNDFEVSMIFGFFFGGLYLFFIFIGVYVDKIGFCKLMFVVFLLLIVGYFGLGVLFILFESIGLVSYGVSIYFSGLIDSVFCWLIVLVLFIIMIGGLFIKFVILVFVVKEIIEVICVCGYFIFYMMVNIGVFIGKIVIDFF